MIVDRREADEFKTETTELATEGGIKALCLTVRWRSNEGPLREPQSEFCQRAVNEMNRNGPFADRRSYAFDVARPNITDGEDTGQIRFQHLGNVARPLPQRFSHRIEIPACDGESFIVERDATSEPFGSRGCSGHDEGVANGMTGVQQASCSC